MAETDPYSDFGFGRGTAVLQTTVKLDGLDCAMCEGNVEDAILRAFPQAKKVDVSHSMGEVRFLTEDEPAEKTLRRAIWETGYSFVSFSTVPYEKRGLFRR